MLESEIRKSYRNGQEEASVVLIDRDRFGEEVFEYLEMTSLKVSPKIIFKNEAGMDMGGLRREFIDLLGKTLKNPRYLLFEELVKKENSEPRFYFHKYLAYTFFFFLQKLTLHKELFLLSHS